MGCLTILFIFVVILYNGVPWIFNTSQKIWLKSHPREALLNSYREKCRFYGVTGNYYLRELIHKMHYYPPFNNLNRNEISDLIDRAEHYAFNDFADAYLNCIKTNDVSILKSDKAYKDFLAIKKYL